ncbi:MAG: HAD family hydrolase [Proteobacteria bacterium]|nr:HAD family hydrolase [Pseudomonadota bacterium]
MHLIMFDVDGTLVESSTYDGRCFIKAVEDLFPQIRINPDLNDYRYVTDSGIAMELIERHTGRNATDAELEKIMSDYLLHMEEEYRADSRKFTKVPGAVDVLDTLKSKDNMALALATGGWGDTARFKMNKSGIDADSLPMASASDAVSREEIMTLAYRRAKERYQVDEFESITYIGDGLWDLKACKNLGYTFVGIGHDIQTLKEHGAKYLIQHYLPIDDFLDLLSRLHK